MSKTIIMKRLWLYSRGMEVIMYDKRNNRFYSSGIVRITKYVPMSQMRRITEKEAREIISSSEAQFDVFTGQKIYANSDFFRSKSW